MTITDRMTIYDGIRDYLESGKWPVSHSVECALFTPATWVDEALVSTETPEANNPLVDAVTAYTDKKINQAITTGGKATTLLEELVDLLRYHSAFDAMPDAAKVEALEAFCRVVLKTIRLREPPSKQPTDRADKQIDKQAFIEQYAERSGWTVEELHDMGQDAYPCDCGWPECEGWRMDDSERLGNIRAEAEDGGIYFVTHNCAGQTFVDEFTRELLLGETRLLEGAVEWPPGSATSEWGNDVVIIRGEVVVPRPQYQYGRITIWEID